MKNLIIPVDFSEDSMKGLDFAVVFSKHLNVNIQMVYVQKKNFELLPKASEEEYEMAERRFEKLKEIYEPKLGNDSKLRFIIKKGRVYQEVVSQAKSYTESLIIASTHGASGFEEVFIGSNAQKIVFESDRPVITIRRDPVPENIKNIILPLDIIMDSRQKVPYTAELAQAFNAKIHVLPISQSKRNVSKITGYVKQVCAYLDSKNIPYESKFMYGKDPAESIIDYAISTNAELISIINEEGPSFTKSLGSIFSKYTQLMINKSPVPVLNYKPKSIFIKGSFN